MNAMHMDKDPVSFLLSKLPGAKATGSRWMAKCPAHADSKPSLQIARGDDGRTLVKCFAGCSLDSILSALGVATSDLFVQDRGQEQPDVIYTYRNGDGSIAYQVVRRAGKQFLQRHPNGGGTWVWNMEGVTRVPYRLPDIVRSEVDDLVFIVEGEKDADKLSLAGLIATTNSGGAGKWGAEHSEHLRGRHVVILPDNDTPGIKHALQVARSLDGIAETITIIRLPDLLPSGDVSDWLDSGHTFAQFRDVVVNAPLWGGDLDYDDHDPSTMGVDQDNLNHDLNAVADSRHHVWRMADVVAEPVDWLWTDFIARGKFGLWEGDPGVGKTYALLAVGSAITRGYGLPGMESVEPQNVLLLTIEDDLADTIRPRLDQLGADLTRFYACDEPVQIDDQGIAFLGDIMDKLKPALVVIDPIMGYIPGNVDIYKPNQIRRITTPLRTLAQKHDCAVVGIRHLTKAQKERAIYRGAGGMDFVGASRLVVLVGRDPNDSKKRAIVQTKTNLGGGGRSCGYVIEENQFYWTQDGELTADQILAASAPEEDKSAVDEAVDFLRQCLANWPKPSKVVFSEAEQWGIKQPTLRIAKKQIGVIITRHGKEGERGGGTWFWGLPGSGPPQED